LGVFKIKIILHSQVEAECKIKVIEAEAIK